MNDSSRSHHACFWLLALAAFLGVTFAGVPPALAQQGEADHLKCYTIIQEEAPDGKTTINSLYSLAGVSENNCIIRHTARAFCAPAIKNGGNDGRGDRLVTEYMCYQLECESAQDRTLFVNDQFGTREITIRASKFLCAPALRGDAD
jgi:hypothetical protein